MNFNKQAEKLEKFLEEEFKSNIKLVVISNDLLLYKGYKISKTKSGWELAYVNGDTIREFKLKACAALAAKYHDRINLRRFNEIVALDIGYWTNYVDSVLFRSKVDNTKDLDKKELFYCRWDMTRHRAQRYKNEISQMFKQSF